MCSDSGNVYYGKATQSYSELFPTTVKIPPMLYTQDTNTYIYVCTLYIYTKGYGLLVSVNILRVQIYTIDLVYLGLYGVHMY